MIVVFTGGTGGTKLVQGLQQVVAPEELTVDREHRRRPRVVGAARFARHRFGSVRLAGLLSKDRGWGVDDDSFRCLERMKQLGEPAWFSLGDLDLATHLTRTAMLRDGKTLSEATAELRGDGHSRARAADVGRSGFDHAGHGEGHAEFSGILRARAP